MQEFLHKSNSIKRIDKMSKNVDLGENGSRYPGIFPSPAVVYAYMSYCERVTSLLSGFNKVLECLYLDVKSPRIRALTASQNQGMK